MSAPSSKGKSIPVSSPGYKPTVPGHVRFNKRLDFGSTNCFDTETNVKAIAAELAADQTLKAIGVYIVDPCQNNQAPLKTQTLLPSGISLTNDPSGTTAGMLVYRGGIARNASAVYVPLPDWTNDSRRILGVANTDNAVIIDTHQMVTLLAIHMAAAGGVATAPLLVEVSVDNTNFLQVDLIAAAAATDLQYTQTANVLNGAAQAGTASGTGASTVKLNPLSFRYIRITAQAGGVSVVTTLTVTMK